MLDSDPKLPETHRKMRKRENLLTGEEGEGGGKLLAD
jgi:hypothetical protein